MLTALIIITIFLIVVMCWGALIKSEDMVIGGGSCLGIVIVLGWLFLGNCASIKTTTAEFTANVLHDKNSCHLTVNDVVVASYNDVVTVKFLTERDTVKVIKHEKWNMYGSNPINPAWTISNIQ
jgi:hypothetical protein